MKRDSIYKNIVLFIIMILLLNITIKPNAKSNLIGQDLYSSQSTIYNGQKLYLTLKINQTDNLDKGYNVYKGILNYDEEVFEKVVKNDFVSLNDWEKIEFNEDTSEFIIIKRAGITTSEDILRVSFKVKDEINVDNTEIILNNSVISNGKSNISLNEDSYQVNLLKREVINPVVDNVNNNFINLDNLDTDYDIYNTLDYKYVLYITIFMLIFIIISVLIYFIYKDYKNKNDNEYNTNIRKFIRVSMFLLLGITILFGSNTVQAAFYDFSLKGELKDDGIVNYDDVSYLELQIINNNILKGEYLDRADINNDKKVNINDLSLLIKRLEKKLDYSVSLTNVTQDENFISKESDFTIKFSGSVNNGAKISKVKINNDYYDVTLDDVENNLYKVNIKSDNNSGNKEYKFTEVILNNKKKIKVKFSESIEIIKSIPVFNNYSVKENINDSVIEMTYELIDKDDAVTFSSIQIINSDGAITREYEAKKGTNTIKIPAFGDEIYNVKFLFDYNLTNNKAIDDPNLVGSIEINKDMQLISDYMFEIGNFRIYSENNSFSKNEQIKIYFDSYNISNFIPSSIRINRKNYDVFTDGNGYYTIIDGFNMLGSNTISITNVTLSNGKVFDLGKENKIIVDIIKNSPYISDFTLENDDLNNLVLRFNTINEDNAIIKLMVNIYDQNYTLIKNINLSESDLNGSKNIVKTIKDISSNVSNYYVNVIGSYSLDNKSSNYVEDVVFYENYFTAKYDVDIANSYTNKQYYEKGEEAILTYNIYTNDYLDISKLFINNNVYDVIKIDDYLYQVMYKVKEDSGIENISVTGVENINGNIRDYSNTMIIEILKDVPVIDNLDDNIIDNSVIDNEEEIEDSELEKYNISIKDNDNSVYFDAKSYSNYKFNINKDDSKNLLLNDFDDEVSILGISTLKNGIVTKYFEKDEKIDIEFIKSNSTKNEISKVIISGQNYNMNYKNGKYNVVSKTSNKSGLQSLSIDKFIFDNKNTIDVKSNNKFSYEVLKDIPTVSNYKQTDNIKESKTNVEFILNDLDNSIISSEIVLKNKDGSISDRSTIKKGKNNFTFKIEPENSYTLEVIVSYDRDIVIDSINNYKNVVLLKKKINGINDYKLVINDLKTYSNDEESIYFEKGEKINLQFQSSNETNNIITEVTINGKKYKATKTGDIYNVSISGYDKSGSRKYTLEKVKLSNTKEIKIKDNNVFEIEILKDIPTIKDLDIISSDENLNVNVGFRINDNDKSLLNGEVIFKDLDGNIIDKQQIYILKNNFVFNVESTGTYMLDINITYDRDSINDDINKVTDKCISSNKIEAIKDYRLVIDNIKTYNDNVEDKYFEKDSKIIIEFESTNITKYDLSEVVINGKNYPVKSNLNKYKVELDGFNESGIYDFSIEKVKLSKDVWIDVQEDKSIQIEVLKDAPTISDYIHIDNVKESKSTIEFNINDSDNSFISGEALLKNNKGEVVDKFSVYKNYNSLELNIEPETAYNFDVNVIYDLDSVNDSINKSSKTLLNKRLTGISDYKVIIENIMTTKDNNYYEKNEKIEISFDSSNVTNYDIKEVIVSDKKYKVNRNDNKYIVLVDGIKKSGIHKVAIEKVILSNSKEIEIKDNNKVEIEVLKDVPTISDYKLKEDGLKLISSFKINDNDKSSVDMVALLRKDDGSVQSRKTIKNGNNTVEFAIEANTSYVIDIEVTYDRDSVIDKTDKKTLVSKDIKPIKDYKLTISNLVSKNGNKESKYFEKDEDITIEFESTNITNKDLSEVTINGKVYEVNKKNKKYSVLLGNISNSGKDTFTIEKVKLTDNTLLDVRSSNKVDIEVLKDSPTISGYTEELNVKESKSTVDFVLNDNDNSFIDGELILKDSDGKVISKKEIVKGNNKVVYDVLPESSYSLDFTATYDRDSNSDNTNKSRGKVILRKKLNGIDDYKITISDLKVLGNKYFEKDNNITLKFNSSNQTNYVIREVTINNKKYKVNRNGNEYTVIIDEISKSGVHSLKIEKVKLSNSKEIDVKDNNKVDIEVLKDVPKVSDFKIDESDDFKVKVNFNVDDQDNSLISGEMVLLKKDKTVVSRKQIDRNKNSLEFDAYEFYDYDLEIRVSYDRDSVSDNTNKYSKTIFSKSLSSVRDYKVKINDLKSKKNNSETVYFERNNTIKLEFTSINNSTNTIKDITINGKKYNVTKNGNIYTVTLEGYKDYGVKTLTIERATLSNNVEVNISDTAIKIEVLKNIPSISSYDEVIDTEIGKAEISFNLNDTDNSIIKAEVEFINDKDNTKVIKEIKKGLNKLEFDIINDTYTLNYRLSYDLDSNEVGNINNNRVLNKVIQSRKVITKGEYNLSISDLNITNSGKKTKYFNKKDKINISFKSTNSNNLDISSVFVGGNEYTVSKNKDTYSIVINGFDSNGEKTIYIDKVKLSNSRIVEVRANNKKKIIVLKSKPSINNYKVERNMDESNVVVFFDVNDSDNAMTYGSVEILDKNNKVIEEAIIKKGNNAIVLSKNNLSKIRFNIKYNISYSSLDTDSNVVGILEAEKNL